MQQKEDILYEMQEIKKIKPKSPRNKSPKSPRDKKKIKHHKKKKHKTNPYIDNDLMNELKLENGHNNNIDPKYIMFRNFLFGRIGLPQYLEEFQRARFSNICKMTDL